MDSMPTKQSVRARLVECREIGTTEFVQKYAGGVGSKAHYVAVEGELYPMKAIWAAAHRPPIAPRDFNTRHAREGLIAMGYEWFVEGEEAAKVYWEGERVQRESAALKQSAALVNAAKNRQGHTCQVCGFDFARRYGELGRGFIEAHHIDPLAGRDGKNEPTTIDDIAVLCANCHSMVHRKTPALTLDELRAMLEPA